MCSVYSNVYGNIEPSPTSADACGEVNDCAAGCQEVGTFSTRGGSQGMYITFTSTLKVYKAEPTSNLVETLPEIQNGYQWPQKRTCVRRKIKKTNKQKNIVGTPVVVYGAVFDEDQ